MSLNKFQELEKGREARHAPDHGVTESGHNLETEQQKQPAGKLKKKKKFSFLLDELIDNKRTKSQGSFSTHIIQHSNQK